MGAGWWNDTASIVFAVTGVLVSRVLRVTGGSVSVWESGRRSHRHLEEIKPFYWIHSLQLDTAQQAGGRGRVF